MGRALLVVCLGSAAQNPCQPSLASTSPVCRLSRKAVQKDGAKRLAQACSLDRPCKTMQVEFNPLVLPPLSLGMKQRSNVISYVTVNDSPDSDSSLNSPYTADPLSTLRSAGNALELPSRGAADSSSSRTIIVPPLKTQLNDCIVATQASGKYAVHPVPAPPCRVASNPRCLQSFPARYVLGHKQLSHHDGRCFRAMETSVRFQCLGIDCSHRAVGCISPVSVNMPTGYLFA